MTTSRSRLPIVAPLVLGLALGAVVTGTAPRAEAYNCKRISNVRLQPTEDGKALKVRGRASIEECFGVTFVRVIVTGPVPDGTGFAPAVIQGEPLLGDFFYATRRKAETGWEIPISRGTVITVLDESFTPLLDGTL